MTEICERSERATENKKSVSEEILNFLDVGQQKRKVRVGAEREYPEENWRLGGQRSAQELRRTVKSWEIARRVGRSRSSMAEDDHENDGCESEQRSGLRI